MEYKWKLKGLTKKVKVDKVVLELQNIKIKYGELTPEAVVEASKKKKSPMHKLFEWDNEKAGHQHRLQQARQIINNIEIVVVKDNEPYHVNAYEIVKSETGREYKSLDIMTFDEAEQVRQMTIKNIEYLQKKLEVYENYADIIIDLQNIKTKMLAIEC